MLEPAALVAGSDPLAEGSGPFVRTLAMLLAATSTRKLAAESPDVAIENMLMGFQVQHKRYAFTYAISKIRRFLF